MLLLRGSQLIETVHVAKSPAFSLKEFYLLRDQCLAYLLISVPNLGQVVAQGTQVVPGLLALEMRFQSSPDFGECWVATVGLKLEPLVLIDTLGLTNGGDSLLEQHFVVFLQVGQTFFELDKVLIQAPEGFVYSSIYSAFFKQFRKFF